jgi:hypothetical protein
LRNYKDHQPAARSDLERMLQGPRHSSWLKPSGAFPSLPSPSANFYPQGLEPYTRTPNYIPCCRIPVTQPSGRCPPARFHQDCGSSKPGDSQNPLGPVSTSCMKNPWILGFFFRADDLMALMFTQQVSRKAACFRETPAPNALLVSQPPFSFLWNRVRTVLYD